MAKNEFISENSSSVHSVNDSIYATDFNESNSFTDFNETSSHYGVLDQLVIFLNGDCVTPLRVASSQKNTTLSFDGDDKTLVVLPQETLFYFANICFVLAYLSPNTRYGQVALHAGLVVGFLVLSTWAWNILCAPDVFAWYFFFMLLNIGQLLYILYQMRPIKFDPDLDNCYEKLFAPMGVSRIQFKRLLGGITATTTTRASAHHHLPGDASAGAQIVTLHAGECYAIQSLTKTDRLALLISGRVNVLNDRNFLHHIEPGEFLDSPEFESSGPNVGAGLNLGMAPPFGDDTTFNVTICAAVLSRVVVWKRSAIEYIFVKDPHIATTMTTLISRDITLKLYNMNIKLRRSEDGANLDIRLPGIAGRLSEMNPRELAQFDAVQQSGAGLSEQKSACKKRQSKTVDFAPPLLIPIHKMKRSKQK